MTTLREAAQQALEVMKSADVDPHSSDAVYKAMDALKAALVEDALQKFTDVSQEIEAALAEPVQESTCNGMPAIEGPLSRSQRMRDAGFTRRPKGWVKDGDGPVQEPVAWMFVDDTGMKFVSVDRPHKHCQPLYTAPPQRPAEPKTIAEWWADKQRKPLSEDEIKKLLIESAGMTVQFGDVDLRFSRAIERAHGIK